jgi:hypothetical protein
MQDTAVTWDLRSLPHESSAEKVLVFFFLIVGMTAFVKLIANWWVAPPFLISRQAGNQSFTHRLQDSARSLSDCMKLTLLFYPLLICFNLYRDCSGLLQSRTISKTELVYLAQEIAVLAEMGFLLALFCSLYAGISSIASNCSRKAHQRVRANCFDGRLLCPLA